MDNNSITVEALINGVLFKPVLINTNCKYYSIVDKDCDGSHVGHVTGHMLVT